MNEDRFKRLDALIAESPLAGAAAAIGRGIVAAENGSTLPVRPRYTYAPPDPEWRFTSIPSRYRWARLEQPIVPPGWDRPHPLISDRHRLRVLSWANGELDGPRRAITITAERNNESVTGAGKSSLAAAIARHVAERLGLSITWIHASDLRGDHDDPKVPRDALRRLLRADLSVLDGVGKELGGAQDVKGWQPARTPLLMEYAARMYENDRGIRITTLDLPGQALAGIYGADLVRRFGRRDKLTGREENATLITL